MSKSGKIWKNTSGATAIEYGLIVGGIALVIVGAIALVGTGLSNVFADIDNNL